MTRLWDHQLAVLPKLLKSPAFGLWWDPGVGKTAPLAVAGMAAGGRQLWLTPANLRRQAAGEIARFRGDDPVVQVVGSGKDRINADAHVVVCSYEMARAEPMWRQLVKLQWASMVCDEAHRLADPQARTTKAVYGARPATTTALWRRSKRVWLASGTPLLNYPHELWTHVSRLWPHLCEDVPTFVEWRDRFCQLRHSDYGLQVVGARNMDELASRWAQTGDRLPLEQAVAMPRLLVDEIAVEATSEIPALPEAVQADLEAALAGDDDLDALGFVLATQRRLIALAKAPAVAGLVLAELQAGLERVIVFGCHVEALRLVHASVTGEGVASGLIVGDTNEAARAELMSAFQAGQLRCLVGNISAMGTGLNLQAGHRIVFLDAAWSPAQNRQAIGRCYRAGQTRPVHVSFASLAGSIDEDVQETLARKAAIVKRLESSSED